MRASRTLSPPFFSLCRHQPKYELTPLLLLFNREFAMCPTRFVWLFLGGETKMKIATPCTHMSLWPRIKPLPARALSSLSLETCTFR